MPEENVVYTWIDGAYRAPGKSPLGGGEVMQSPPGLPAAGKGFALGMYVSSIPNLLTLESDLGRQFDGITRYRDSNMWTNWPASDEVQFVNRGGLVRYAFGTRVFGYASYTQHPSMPPLGWDYINPADSQRYVGFKYSQFLNGSMDPLLDKIFSSLKTMAETYGTTFIFDIGVEMDDNPYVLEGFSHGIITYNNAQPYSNPTMPDPQEYVAYSRYVINYGKTFNIPNILWGFCPAGWTLSRNATRLGHMYPGDDYVDVIMWDPYNNSGSNWRSFTQIVSPMYNAIDGGLFGSGAINKPRFLGEVGALTGDARRPAWITSIATEAQNFPKLRGAIWFSSGTWGAIHGSNGTPAELTALRGLMDHPYLTNWTVAP